MVDGHLPRLVLAVHQPLFNQTSRLQRASFETRERQWYIARANIPLVPSGARREAAPKGRPLLFPGASMKTYVFVDGFNLYYGAVKGTPFRWLDIRKLCQLLLPKHEIACIKYFTARVSARPGDPDKPTRQQTFLRALATLPNLQIIYGHFLTNEISMPQAGLSPGSPQKYVKVIKTE